MSDEIRICVTIGPVDVSAELPVRADGALPYSLADVLGNATAEAIRAYRESGIGLIEFIDDEETTAGE